jgi:excisionase family DNA binding protein
VSRPLGAHVGGSDAFLLSMFLQRRDVRVEFDEWLDRLAVVRGVDPGRLRSLREVVYTIHAAGRAARAAADEADGVSAISARKGVIADIDGGSRQELEITPKEASAMLNLTESRVRQMLRKAELEGRKVDGLWRVPLTAVAAHRDTPRGDAA